MKRLSFILVLALAGCASKTEKKIEKDITQQPEVTSAQAADSGRQAIENSEKLTAEQKQKLLFLMGQTQVEMASIRKSEAQIKSSLFKYLAAGQFEDREIEVYRKDLKKVEDKKMNLMFSNIMETRRILGKGTEFPRELMNLHMMNAEQL